MTETLTHTHTGYSRAVGYRHHGARLHGHVLPKSGKTHALTIQPNALNGSVMVSLCGETVLQDGGFDEWGEPIRPNVRSVEDPAVLPVTCKRCLRQIAKRHGE